ncbi:MAG: hypothetical protein CMK09_08500 [Ponticaulis sp.]|nr:hypothetical protein [Ponticaulis sp.]
MASAARKTTGSVAAFSISTPPSPSPPPDGTTVLSAAPSPSPSPSPSPVYVSLMLAILPSPSPSPSPSPPHAVKRVVPANAAVSPRRVMRFVVVFTRRFLRIWCGFSRQSDLNPFEAIMQLIIKREWNASAHW